MKKLNVALLALVLSLSLGACTPKFSSEDKKNGKVALCAMADSLSAQLKVGGATARAAAGVIKSNTTDKNIRAAATGVQKGSNVAENRKVLRNYLARKC